ncbi:MAG: hypothetical protein ACRENO_04950 [Thermodesulfobacteriota bacterium]
MIEKLESILDNEVNKYLTEIKEKKEVKDLVSGEIEKDTYVKFLKTFYLIEFLSQRAVNMASIYTEEKYPYLSKKFHSCAVGELGHAEIALKDLKDMGEDIDDPFKNSLVKEYDRFLQKEAENFPLSILGHSYLFENVSGTLFPESGDISFPSRFIKVHAKEDPGHSIAIKRTVRNIEDNLDQHEIEKIIQFSRKSGDYLLKLFETA